MDTFLDTLSELVMLTFSTCDFSFQKSLTITGNASKFLREKFCSPFSVNVLYHSQEIIFFEISENDSRHLCFSATDSHLISNCRNLENTQFQIKDKKSFIKNLNWFLETLHVNSLVFPKKTIVMVN
jgi:hypothetical protein